MYIDKGYGIDIDELVRNHPLPKGYGKRLYDHICNLHDTNDVIEYISDLTEDVSNPNLDSEEIYDKTFDIFEDNNGSAGIWNAVCTAISMEQKAFFTDEFCYEPACGGLYCRFYLPQDEKAKTKMPTLLDVQNIINKYLDILYDNHRPEIEFKTIVHAENYYD